MVIGEEKLTTYKLIKKLHFGKRKKTLPGTPTYSDLSLLHYDYSEQYKDDVEIRKMIPLRKYVMKKPICA